MALTCRNHIGLRVSADDPAQLWPTERPQYESLRVEVERAWRATRGAFGELREEWLRILRRPRRAFKAAMPPEDVAGIDRGIEGFLAQFAGAIRTVEQFARADTPDGILQQEEIAAWYAGAGRAKEQLRWPMNPEFTRDRREALMRSAFARMSENGRLRFEDRLGEIRQSMLDGFDVGENPLAIARRLGRDLDSYEQGRLRMIVRTEAAIASGIAILDTYRQADVTEVEIIGDPLTDALCTSRIGNRYPIDDADNMPPYHPNCFCSEIPVVEGV